MGSFCPSKTPKVCQAWLIWAPNPNHKCPLRYWKKIWPLYWILSQLIEFLSKNSYFWRRKWSCFPPPGHPRFAGHGSFWPQIQPTNVPWETEKKCDLYIESCLNKLSFCHKQPFLEEEIWSFCPFRTPKVCQAWLIWAQNLTHKCPLRNWEIIWPLYGILSQKIEFLSKNSHFWGRKYGRFAPPGPPRFSRHGSFGP